MSPTDEETCSYLTEEEFSAAGDSLSVNSDFDNVQAAALSSKDTVEVIKGEVPALRFSAFPNLPPYLNFSLHDEKGS